MKKEMYLWDRMAKSFHRTSSTSKAHRDKYRHIADLIMASNPSSILDLGCGSGILEKELIERGYGGIITAIDASESMLEIARRIAASPNCDFIKADLDSNFILSKSYDVVVSINLLFFLENKVNFIRKISQYMKSEESTFYLVTPKPNEDTSNLEFVREHFRNTSLIEKVFIFINEIANMPKYLKMSWEQRKIYKMADRGEISFDRIEGIKMMAVEAKLNIIKTEDIHAKQNWLFIMRRVF